MEDFTGETTITVYPNHTAGQAIVCEYMYGYTSTEMYDLHGRKFADLV